MENIQLAIVEDDTIIRESLESFLGVNTAIQINFVATSVEDFLNALKVTRNPQVDVMLLDIGLPGMSGLEGISYIKKELPNVDIIMLTTFEEEEKIFKALCNGAVSYITKRTPLTKIQEAIFTIYRGGSYMSPSIARKVINHFTIPQSKKETSSLSDRQKEIVNAIVEGFTYSKIAEQLHISTNTVRDHIKKIYRLLEVNSKTELIKKSMKGEI